jgi:hypothetical protein
MSDFGEDTPSDMTIADDTGVRREALRIAIDEMVYDHLLEQILDINKLERYV